MKSLPTSILLLSLCLSPTMGSEPTEIDEPSITAIDREHWAFRPIDRPVVPVPEHRESCANPIDRFVLEKLQTQGLEFAPIADRGTLLRRVTFLLTGLPPTTDAMEEFERDRSPTAYQHRVDRLLASAEFGERWGQAWLDLASFADTDGFEHDKVRANAWEYRDWVIHSLNQDEPYDQFVCEQLAGDLLDPKSSKIATMFCLAGPDMPDLNDQEERRHFRLNQLTASVGSVFLGLQMGCAECHDHKYDPISQADFYRLRAVFEPAFPKLTRDQGVNLLEQQSETPPARLWLRGDHRRPGPVLVAAYPRIAQTVAKISDRRSNPSRSDFANWLVSADNPLVARVAVNRLWQQLLGRGIFDTPSDVGVINSGPTHPELLDWLAAEFRSGGWQTKKLLRLVLNSQTFRQSSRSPTIDKSWSRRLAIDPANHGWSRYLRRRLEGEAIRDAMLATAGLLVHDVGGPGVMPPLPEELVNTLLEGQWKVAKREADHYRRSIYLFARRNLRYPLFEAFDRPDANASCPVRGRSTTAPQALVLFNSEFSAMAAKSFANQLVHDSPIIADQIAMMWLRAVGRRPSNVELQQMTVFLDEQSKLWSSESVDLAALQDACLVVFNANEFIYLD